MLDNEFQEKLRKWKRDQWAWPSVFTTREFVKLHHSRRAIRPDRRMVVYCVYENMFAKGGGILAVARYLPPALLAFNQVVFVLSPLHRGLKTAPPRYKARLDEFPIAGKPAPQPSPLTWFTTIQVPFGRKQVSTDIWHHTVDGVRWYLFEAEGFFEAPGGQTRTNPYDFTSYKNRRARSKLANDSLFAAAAIPHVMAALGCVENLVFHVQDWELAATALTVREAILDEVLFSAAVVLTTHNPYDNGLLPRRTKGEPGAGELKRITKRVSTKQWPSLRERPRRESFYECMIPLTDAPVSTVSRKFAEELTADPLQSLHFARHMQEVLKRQGLVGVDNGLFMAPQPAFSEAAMAEGAKGNPSLLLQEKAEKRRRWLDALAVLLAQTPPSGMFGTPERWFKGLSAEGKKPAANVPIFLMFGRLDPGQKGFDVFCRAIEKIEPGKARFILSAIAGGGAKKYIQDMQRFAKQRKSDVLVFTGTMPMFHESIAGASFCVMPSMYEPFGAATEPYLSGTPVVARATGGLVQQVVDLHDAARPATGILYREQFPVIDPESLAKLWRKIMDADDPKSRVSNPLYASLVQALAGALQRAIALYDLSPDLYGRLLGHLHSHALQFSWKKAAEEYTALYNLAGE